MSLAHWFNSKHSYVVSEWLGRNPGYADTDANAGLIFAQVGDSPTPANLDAAAKKLPALCGEIDYDLHGLGDQPAWTLTQALLARIERCPLQGAREKMRSNLYQFLSSGFGWFAAEGMYKPKPQ